MQYYNLVHVIAVVTDYEINDRWRWKRVDIHIVDQLLKLTNIGASSDAGIFCITAIVTLSLDALRGETFLFQNNGIRAYTAL